MENVKYVCFTCNYESDEPGECPECQAYLVAYCTVCGNPIVGEQIQPLD